MNKYSDPEILKHLDKIIFEFNRDIEGTLPGRHRSKLIGKSLEFVQHREYVKGDDLRYIDWKVYGRRDKFFVKQYHQETNLVCYILLDCSSSMWYPLEKTKYEYAGALASYISYILLNQNDSVGLIKFDNQILKIIQPKSGQEQYYRILEEINLETFGGKSDFITVISLLTKKLRKYSLLIIISDLICSQESFLVEALKKIAYSKINIIVLHIVSKEEYLLNFDLENVTFEDVEDNTKIKTNIDEIKSLYIKEFDSLLKYYKTELYSANIGYFFIDTSKPILENLELIIYSQ